MKNSVIKQGGRTVIAMAHVPALPGSPDYKLHEGMQKLHDWVGRDIEALQSGGVDAIMFGNEFDRPYVLKAPPEGLAALTAVVTEAKKTLKVPFGVNYLWDPVATVALASATGASFAREIYTGVYASDMGLWVPDCAGAARLRSQLGNQDLQMLFNINAEFATSLDTRPLSVRAQSAVFSSKADVVCVSGPMTGQGVEQSELAAVREVLPETPLLANTGVNLETVREIMKVADGCVIGTHLKKDGNTWNPVDVERVKRFMDKVTQTIKGVT
ncbi:MAG: BtpA/SgcQ family protein [SAR324 cluster bacterium]|nr:BtpA/SgcQ family protein [SAR324 cluster bacterium]